MQDLLANREGIHLVPSGKMISTINKIKNTTWIISRAGKDVHHWNLDDCCIITKYSLTKSININQERVQLITFVGHTIGLKKVSTQSILALQLVSFICIASMNKPDFEERILMKGKG